MASRATFLVAVAVVAGGCGDQIGSAHGDRVLRGGIRYAGGPSNDARPGFEAGTVNLLRDGQNVDVAKLNEGERFEFHVRPGNYTLSTDLGFKCEHEVQVDAPVVEADLECSIK